MKSVLKHLRRALAALHQARATRKQTDKMAYEGIAELTITTATGRVLTLSLRQGEDANGLLADMLCGIAFAQEQHAKEAVTSAVADAARETTETAPQ